MDSYTFGIDLGTTNSLIAYYRPMRTGADVQTIANQDGADLTPSVVFFYENSSEYCVGKDALDEYIHLPERTFRCFKRYMGNDLRWPLTTNINDCLEVTPTTLSARILKKVAEYCRQGLKLDKPPNRAVITVPAYFGDSAKGATIAAAEVAGFSHVRLIEEPTAAVLDYIVGLQRSERIEARYPSRRANIAIFDLGGGTFDISVASLDITDAQKPKVRILASEGSQDLGGYLFDLALAQHVLVRAKESAPSLTIIDDLIEAIDELRSDNRVGNPEYQSLLADFLIETESVKKGLSSTPTPSVGKRFRLPSRLGKSINVHVTRGEFEAVIAEYLADIENRVEKALTGAIAASQGELAGWANLDEVVLIGGSTRIPAVQDLVTRVFGREPAMDADADLAVARGAAIQAAIDSGLPVLNVTRCTSHAYGVLAPSGSTMHSIVIPPATPYPCKMTATHRVAFSLAESVPFRIGEQYHDGDGQAKTREVRKVAYHHPFLYTGDSLQVELDIDENGMVAVSIADERTGEHMEATVIDALVMTQDQKAKERHKVDQLRDMVDEG